MIARTWPLYLAARALIYLLRDLPWICLGYFFVVLALGGVDAIAFPLSVIIEVLGAVEILFYVFFFLPYRQYLQFHKPYKPPALSRPQRMAMFYKSLDMIPHGDVATYLRKWMLDVPFEDIKRENMRDWIFWMLFDIDYPKESVTKEMLEEVEEYLVAAETRLSRKIPEGRTPSVDAIRLCFDPVIVQHRPLVMYLSIGAVDLLFSLYMKFVAGFEFWACARGTFFKCFPMRPLTLTSRKRSAVPTLSYWFRPHRSKAKRPIVFLHGLGSGLMPYTLWLRSLDKDVGILAIELLSISSRVTNSLPPTPEIIEQLNAVLKQQIALHPGGEWDDFVLVGNSYGTLLMPGVLQHPELGPRVGRNVLIDPVSLLLHLPDLAYNYTRREPERSKHGRPGHGFHWFIWWASATDGGTAFSLARRFCWRENVMWREDLMPSMQVEGGKLRRSDLRSTVILGAEDCVTAPSAVASYVYSGSLDWTPHDVDAWKKYEWTGQEELELVYLVGQDHGQSILTRTPDARLTTVMDEYLKKEKYSGVASSIYPPEVSYFEDFDKGD